MKPKQPWLHSAFADALFILAPPFLCLLAVIIFQDFFQKANSEVSVGAWVVLVLLIDVGHVYSTLFRTYFDKQAFQEHRQLFLFAPVLGFLGGILLYSFGSMVFWRVLAYLAVYHFIRQQYGFMQLYSRKENKQRWEGIINKITIYAATLYPVLYWHLESKRRFNWFMEGDFVSFSWPEVLPFLNTLYVVLLLIFLVKEIRFAIRNQYLNIPRNMVILGTVISWYLGIIYFNGDLIFTLFNVVSHGIPYMALVWFYGKKKHAATGSDSSASWLSRYAFSTVGVFIFLGIISVMAFMEEGLWDAFVWRERSSIFSAFQIFPAITDEVLLSFLVPLLALPQLTHYILDGYIWKVSKDKNLT